MFAFASPVSADKELKESIADAMDRYIDSMERYYLNYNAEFVVEKESRDFVINTILEYYGELWKSIPSEEEFDWLRDAFTEGLEMLILNSPSFNVFHKYLIKPTEENKTNLHGYLDFRVNEKNMGKENFQYVLNEGIKQTQYKENKKESYEWMRFVIQNTRTLFKENKVYLSYWDLNDWSDVRIEDFDIPIATVFGRPYPYEVSAVFRRVLTPDLHPEINEFLGLQPSHDSEGFFRKFGDAFIDEFYYLNAQEVIGYFRDYYTIFNFKSRTELEDLLSNEMAQERFLEIVKLRFHDQDIIVNNFEQMGTILRKLHKIKYGDKVTGSQFPEFRKKPHESDLILIYDPEWNREAEK